MLVVAVTAVGMAVVFFGAAAFGSSVTSAGKAAALAP
jgi:hypothetical protein